MDQSTASIARLLTYSEVAEILGVAVATLKKWVSTGRIPHCKVGRCVRFTEHQLRWIIETSSVANPKVDQ